MKNSDTKGLPTVTVVGYPVVAASFEETVKRVSDGIAAGEKQVVFALNPLKLERAEKDAVVAAALRRANWLIPDGAGILWAAKQLGKTIPERIPGVDFMAALCAWAAGSGKGIFLYGSTDEHLAAAKKTLEGRYPGIRICGYCNGYTENSEAVKEKIRESGAEMLFVALGSPKQEIFIAQNMDKLPEVLLIQGIGGTVDVLAGAVKRAPVLWQKLRLEWLWRFMKEPKRFSQMKTLVRFVKRIKKEKQQNGEGL